MKIKANFFIICVTLALFQFRYSIACGSIAPTTIKVDDIGNIFTVWHESESDQCSIKARVKYANSSWSDVIHISDDQSICGNPTITTDESGNAVALWLSVCEIANKEVLYAACLPYNEEWQKPVKISDGKAHILPSTYQVKITNNQDVIITWNSTEKNPTGNAKTIINVSESKFGEWKTGVPINRY